MYSSRRNTTWHYKRIYGWESERVLGLGSRKPIRGGCIPRRKLFPYTHQESLIRGRGGLRESLVLFLPWANKKTDAKKWIHPRKLLWFGPHIYCPHILLQFLSWKASWQWITPTLYILTRMIRILVEQIFEALIVLLKRVVTTMNSLLCNNFGNKLKSLWRFEGV